MNEELSELLDETNRCLEKEGKVVVITYDSLDFCMDREVRGGLISELLAFWAENNLRYQGLRAKIFLRNDIFKKEVMLPDKIKSRNVYKWIMGGKYYIFCRDRSPFRIDHMLFYRYYP